MFLFKKTSLLSASISGAIVSVTIPLTGILALDTSDYGLFSFAYLFYALAVSVQLSVISEPWARARVRRASSEDNWQQFSVAQSIFVALACFGFLLGSQFAGIGILDSLFLTLGVGGTLRYLGVRYFHLATASFSRPFIADLTGITACFLILLLFITDMDNLRVISILWSAVGVSSALVFGRPPIGRLSSLFQWVSIHKKDIKYLLADSSVLDVSSIGVPLVIGAFLPTSQFGIYRAVSSVALPVRLMLSPIRASISRVPVQFWHQRKGILLAFGPGALFAVLCYISLTVLSTLSINFAPALVGLAPFALPTSLFVFANYFGQLFYFICRVHGRHNRVLIMRLVQTLATVIAPLAGLFYDGLPGSIWGFALAHFSTSFLWFFSALKN